MYKKFINNDQFTATDANALMRQGIIALAGEDASAAGQIDQPYDGMRCLIAGRVYVYRSSFWHLELIPNPVTWYSVIQPNNTPNVTEEDWATLPSSAPQSLTTPLDLWADIRFGGSLRATGGTTGHVSLSVQMTGATTIAPGLVAAIPIRHPSTLTTEPIRYSGSRVVKLFPGTTSFQLHAMQAGGGTRKVDSPYLEIVPLKWSSN